MSLALKPYTYLLINFLAVIVCFVASFDKRLQFQKQFGAFLKSAVVVGVPFILWDVWFTAKGVWWFNSDYTIGWTLAGLPVEEWLFFLCIPFSCTFTYFCLEIFFDWDWANAFQNILIFISVIILTVVALVHHDKIYTFVTAVFTVFTLLYLHFVARKEWLGRASLTFLILMLGFFPVNGVLTGTGLESPIVNYNPEEFMGIRMLTIPIEDAVYGYAQFLWILFFFKRFQRNISA